MSVNDSPNFLQVVVRYSFPTIGWLVLVIACAYWMVSWALVPEWHYEKLARVPSPDSRHEAVVTRASAGATTSYEYAAFIVTKGASFDPKRAILVARSLTPECVSWAESNTLEIRLPPGRVAYYESIWPYPVTSSGTESIQVHLNVDYSLSPSEE